jgi:hypothetical protein
MQPTFDMDPGGVGPPIEIVVFKQDSDKAWRASELSQSELGDVHQRVEAIETAMVERSAQVTA